MAELDDSLAALFGSGPAQTAPGVTASAPPITAIPSDAAKTGNVVDPFRAVPALAQSQNVADTRAQAADDMLSDFIDKASKIHQANESTMAQTVAAKTALNQDVNDTTANYGSTVAPMFQRKVAIANRAAEVAAMNPFKRAIVSTFSLGHNPAWLAEQDQAVNGQITAQTAQYQNLMGIHDTVAKVLTDNENNAEGLNNLKLEDGKQDLQLAMQGVGSANQVVATHLQGLQADQEILRTQQASKLDLLDTMTHGQINQALSQTQKNKGTAIVNGIPLAAGELQEKADNWSKQEMSLKTAALGLQAQQLDVTNAAQNDYISRLSGPQLQHIMANGGKTDSGMALNQESLARALQAQNVKNQGIIEQAGQQGAAPVYASALRAIGTNQSIAKARTANLFGNTPQDFSLADQQMAAQIQAMADGLQKVKGTGAANAYMAAQVPVLQGIAESQRKRMENLGTSWGRGDKDLTAFATSFLTGDPLNPETGANAMVKMVRSGIPAGTTLTAAAQESYNVAKGIVTQFDAPKAGMDLAGGFGKPSTYDKKGVDVDPVLTRQVAQAIQDHFSQSQMDNAMATAPLTARSIIGENGQPHPFSRVNPADMQSSTAYGDQQAKQKLAQVLGATPQDAANMLSEGPSGPTYTKYSASKKGSAIPFGTLASQYVSDQQQSTMHAIDLSPSAVAGFKPSAALVDLLNNPEYQQKVVDQVNNQAGQSAGDYAVNAIAGTTFASQMFNHNRNYTNSYGAATMAQRTQAITTAAKLKGTNPIDAAALTMHSLPNLNESDANLLLKAAIPAADQLLQDSPPGSLTPSTAIDRIITGHQFQDPALEKIRQTAAREWMRARPNIQKGLAGMLSAGPDSSILTTPQNPGVAASVAGP